GLFSLSGFVSFFDRFLFGDVLTLLGLAVETRAFLVIDMRLGVDPHETVPSAGDGCRFSDRLGCACGGRNRSGGSGRARGSLRLKEVGKWFLRGRGGWTHHRRGCLTSCFFS